MKRILYLIAAVAVLANAQGNWTTYGGDPQRSGWEKNDPAISKATVKDLQLLWKMKLETKPGSQPVYPPLIVGRLISYKGFKELAIVGTNADMVYAIDADLGKLFWQKHLEYAALEPQAKGSCAQMAMPTMPPPPGRGGRGAATPVPAAGGRVGSPFIGGLGPASVYAISSDGRLHRLNISTGDDIVQPVSVLPPNSRAYALNMADNVIYAVIDACNGKQSAAWATDLNVDPPKVTSSAFIDGPTGLAGPVIGSDGTVYVQDSVGGQAPQNWWLHALGRELKPKQSFVTSLRSSTASSPVVFAYKGRELVVTGSGDGHLYLLDSTSFSGIDRVTALYETSFVGAAGPGIYGSISTWEDPDGTRWVLGSVGGALAADLKAPVINGPTPNGSIVAFKVEEKNGKTVLTPAWVSRDLVSPQPPVIASGVVFALSAGSGKNHATLYALDAATGKELYSSRNLITAPASLTGMTVANGRVYFGTTDGTLYAFGMYMEH